jgi:hypothetical protein
MDGRRYPRSDGQGRDCHWREFRYRESHLQGEFDVDLPEQQREGRADACQYLLLKNARVYVAARSKERGQVAVEELKRITGKTDVRLLQLDLGDLKSVKRAAADFQLYEFYLLRGGGAC